MVTLDPDTSNPKSDDAAETRRLDEVRTASVVRYRRQYAEADRWADGMWPVEHSIETQERVFRMAEQLAGRGVDRMALFAALRRADSFAVGNDRFSEIALQPRHLYLQGRTIRDGDFRREPWRHSLTPAIAGCGAVDALLGEHGTVVNLLPAEAFEEHVGRQRQGWIPRTQAGRVMILIGQVPTVDQLRARGFDPVSFDGTDPAAYAWAIFELASRAEADAARLACECHPGSRTIPLGIALSGSSPNLREPGRLTVATPVPAYA